MSRSVKKRWKLSAQSLVVEPYLALVVSLAVGASTGVAARAAAPRTRRRRRSPVRRRRARSSSATGANGVAARPTTTTSGCAATRTAVAARTSAAPTTATATCSRPLTSATRSASRCRRRTRTATATESSVPTAVVTAATKPPPTPAPASNGCAKTGGTLPVASVSPPARLTIDQTQISPSTIAYSTRAVTARFHVSACSGSVEGALVYVTAVPYGQFGIANEQPTGSDGWATVQFTALGRLPGQQQTATAGDVRPRPQSRRQPARRHLHPPTRLLPRHTRLTERTRR